MRFRLALWRLIRNLSVARDGGRKNPRSDLIPSAMLDSMTVGLNIIFLDNDGPNVPITKVVVKKTVLVEAATVSPLLSHHVALTVALHVWSSSELIPADRELIQSESSVAQILSNDSIPSSLSEASFRPLNIERDVFSSSNDGITICKVSKRWRGRNLKS